MTNPKSLSRVLVLGAHGGTGRELLRALGARHEVTAFARGSGAAGPSRLVQGDVLDPRAVERAVEGQDAVVWAIGGHDAIRTWLSRRPRQSSLCERGTANVVAAMRRAGVSRLVVISSWGVGDGRARLPIPFRFVLPLVMGAELRDKAAQEELVRASDLAWTILRPAILTTGPEDVRLSVSERPSFRARSRVPRAALARLVGELLPDAASHGRCLEITD